MADDLIPTKEVSDLLGVSVATINRWAADGREDRPQPALTLPGETGARLYRRADVDAYRASHNMCPTCAMPTWHGADPCPEAMAS